MQESQIRIHYFEDFGFESKTFVIWGTLSELDSFAKNIASLGSLVFEADEKGNGKFYEYFDSPISSIKHAIVKRTEIKELVLKLENLIESQESGHNYIDLESGVTLTISFNEYPADFPNNAMM